MARLTASRRAALEVMRSVRAGDLLDRALDRAMEDLPPRERAWLHELAYGSFRLRGRLDFLLDALVRGGTESLEPDVLDVLRLGAYQLREMGSVPPYAAISQSVELARAAGAARASGLVNGVLQALRRRGEQIDFPDPERDSVAYLESWGSHPRWLLERWVEQFGLAETRALVEANNRRPELYLRPLGAPPSEAIDRLNTAGITAKAIPFAPDSLRVLPPAGAREALAAVPAVVQDPAAALVARYAAVPAGARVLDLCAAPGGKALGMADAAGYVAAADVSLGRLRRVRENVERAELGGRIGMVVADARHPPFQDADLVLLDAPCTGTGTLRRHPDGRWRISESELSALVGLQQQLLDAAAALVRPSGFLVYSTCSLEPEENELQIERFLARHPGFVRESAAMELVPGLVDETGALRVLPQRHGVDGSFAVRLRRAA